MLKTWRQDWVNLSDSLPGSEFLTSPSIAQVETLLSSEAALNLSSRELPIGNGKPGTYPATGAGNYWNNLEIDMIMADEINGANDQSLSGTSMPPLIADRYFSNELIGFGLQENLPSGEVIDELWASVSVHASYVLTSIGMKSILPRSIHRHQPYTSIAT
jgi:hypothetical protein